MNNIYQYLIMTTREHIQSYVGSAYNENGIWGRWADYVRTNGHGDNKALKELVKSDKDYAYNDT